MHCHVADSWTLPFAGENLHSISGWEWTWNGKKRIFTGCSWNFDIKVSYPEVAGLVFTGLCKRLGIIAGLDMPPTTKWCGERSH